MIHVSNLSFRYTNQYVFQDISFTISKGTITGLVGENGVGKSTLFKCLLGFLMPDQGIIQINEKDITKLKPKEVAQLIAYIPQSHNPTFNHTVLNVVEMGANARLGNFEAPSVKERERAKEVLDMMGLSFLANRGYKEISGGERQLALISRAIMQDAKVLIMDEPTANLDYGNQVKVLEKCQELAEKGYTIIQSTHHPQQVFTYFDDCMVMKDKKLWKKGKVEEVLTEEVLSAIYKIPLKIVSVMDEGQSIKMILPKKERKE